MTVERNILADKPYGEAAGRLTGTERPGWILTIQDESGTCHTLDSFSNSPVRIQQNGARRVWEAFDTLPDAGLTVVMTRSLRDIGSAWHLSVENQGRAALRDVTFPVFRAETLDEDTILLPTVSGRLHPAGKPLAYNSECNEELTGEEASLTAGEESYPSGTLTMQCAGLYGPSGGIYVGVHDPFASNKRLAVTNRNGVFDLRWTWTVPDMNIPGTSWNMPGEILIRPFEGDWFDVAQIYRAWVSQEAHWWPRGGQGGRPDTPDWFKDNPVWMMCNGPWPYRDPPVSIEQAVAKIKRFAAYMDDLPCAVHWYNWHAIDYDTDYPNYFPARDGFADGVRDVQAAGVRVMTYINAHIWDMDTDTFCEEVERAAIKSEDGTIPVKSYNDNTFAPMCPATPLWQNTLMELVGKLTDAEHGVDGVYLDQVSAQAAMKCFDTGHGHPPGGGCWWTTQGYWPLLDEMRRRSPGIVLTSESSAEPYVNRLDGYLTWVGYREGEAAVPLFHAVYAGQVQLFGRLYKWDSWKGVAMRAKTAQALVWGEQLGWIVPEVIDDPVAGPFLKRLVRLRHTLRPYLARGRMARPPKLKTDGSVLTSNWVFVSDLHVTTPAVCSGAWFREDGKAVALILVNADDQAHEVELPFDAKDYALKGMLEAREWIATEDPAAPPAATPVEARWQRQIHLPPLAARVIEIFEHNTQNEMEG